MEWIKGISCIYKITNKVNGKFYIGQTISIDDRHKYSYNYKNCTKLYEDIEKYGWHSFIKEVVEIVPQKDLDKKELEYIKQLNPFYNIRGGDSSINQIADTTKKKLSDVMKTKNIKRNPVINLDTGEVFSSISDASKKHNIPKISISRACRGIYKTSGGFHWEYC